MKKDGAAREEGEVGRKKRREGRGEEGKGTRVLPVRR